MIGAGYAAEHLHYPAFRRVSEIRVLTVCDLDHGCAERLASRLPGAKVAADAAAVIANGDVEAVTILTPPETHVPLIAAALDAGKHVFVEKPLTSKPEELDWLLEKAASVERVVAVGHNLRCHRFVRQARAIIQIGGLGEILAIRTVWTSTPREGRDGVLAGGVLLDLGVHHFDLFAYLGGSPVEAVAATFHDRGESSETAAVSGRLRSGTVLTSVVSWQGISEHAVHVAGTKGAIGFSFERANSWRATTATDLGLRAQASEIRQYLRQIPDVFRTIGTGGDWLESYRAQWANFASAIRQGTAVACSIVDAAAAVKACAQAGEAALRQKV